MTTKTDPEMPAFPRTYSHEGHNGMTLRDYFAAKVMTQLMDHTTKPEITARDAYAMADAMLRARGGI